MAQVDQKMASQLNRRQSSMNLSMVQKRKAADPNDLDFKSLRQQYMEDTSLKLKFSKPSFLHYCQNPYSYGHKYGGNDTLLAMEIIQAPNGLKYTNLQDPAIAKAKKKEAKIAAEKARVAAEKAAAKAKIAAEKQAKKDAIKAEKARLKELRTKRKAHPLDVDSDEDYDDEDEDEESDEVSEDEEEEMDLSDEDDDYGFDSYGDDGEDGSETPADSNYGDEEVLSDEERQYDGDMFSPPPLAYVLSDRTVAGEYRQKTDTTDSVNISIWRIGGANLRFSRMADVMIPYPPAKKDERFYCSHTSDAIYWLSMKDGKQCVVTCYLADFTYRVFEFQGEDIPILKSLENSSMICGNRVLCVNLPLGLGEKKEGALSGDFVAFDLYTLENIWTAPNAERVFFAGICIEDDDPINEDDENPKDGSMLSHQPDLKEIQILAKDKTMSVRKMIEKGEVEMPEKIIVLTQEVIEVAKAGAEEKKPNKEKKEKKETLLQFQFYRINDFNTKDYKKDGELYWEYSEVTLMKPATNKPEDNLKQKLLFAMNDPEKEQKKSKASLKPNIIYMQDNILQEMIMIVIGKKGQQHFVHQFNSEGSKSDRKMRQAKKTTQRPGNCTVRINQNSHIRTIDQLFIILIASSGQTEAKTIGSCVEANEKFPTVSLLDADENYALDCWLNVLSNEHTGEETGVIQTICKSTTDEYLNSSSINISAMLKDDYDPSKLKKLQVIQCKIKNQEINMQYPVIVSNIGTRRINVQSIAQPDVHAQFQLADSDFLAFADYNNLQQIGFNDKRKKSLQSAIPFSETGEYVAFLSRGRGKCDQGEDCTQGDMLLNILYVDSYSEPMVFEHYTTNYEACMMEGCRDDVIHKAYAFEVKSGRGCDVTLAVQYNDSIIFDCVTSTKQNPIKFPMTKKELESGAYEEIKATLDIKTLPVPMFMDKDGSIYLVVTNEENQVKIYRVNTDKEMGEDAFFQLVYSFNSTWVYFFQRVDDLFYLMDDSKRVRVLEEDVKTRTLSVQTTMELCKADKEQLKQSAFDEFAITPGCIHWDDKALFLLDSKTKDNATWASVGLTINGYETVAGPKEATGSGLNFYISEYTGIDEDDTDDLFVSGVERYGKFCVVIMPKADLSFTTCLPIQNFNHNNFCTFIGQDKVMVQYGGRFLIFNVKGEYMGEVKFECASHINIKRLKLVNFDENKEYFIFEGPEMLPEEKKKKKKTGDDAAKRPESPSKKRPKSPSKKGKSMFKEERPKDFKPPKWIYYVFKMTHVQNQFGDGRRCYHKLTHQSMIIDPVTDAQLRFRTNILMNSTGIFEQTCITRVDRNYIDNGQEFVNYQVVLQSVQSSEIKTGKEEVESSWWFGSKAPVAPAIEEIKLNFEFKGENVNAHIDNLTSKIRPLDKAKTLANKKGATFGHKDELLRLNNRQNEMYKAWKYGKYVIVKCGSELQYANIKDQIPQKFNFDLGQNVWLQNVYLTGVEGLIQFYAIDDVERHVYVITWNMESNREHSLFQTCYKKGQLPENLIIQSFTTGPNQTNFNFCLDDGCLINLENNLPIQFFDIETEGDAVPKTILKNTVSGQKRVSGDHQRYLDLLVPGRIQHFISFADLVYWERYQTDKLTHELSKGKLTSFSPIAKFPKGISVFHYYSTNEKLLKTVQEYYELALAENNGDKRINLLPLMFLHKHPIPNKAGTKLTPLQLTMEKQSPVCFETMLGMLTSQQSVCITGHLLGRLQEMIGMGSPAVTELMNKSFRITDQLDGPRPLEWPGEDSELFINVSTAYLTDETLQQLVYDKMDITPPADDAAEEEQIDTSNQKGEFVNGFLKYSVDSIEAIAQFDDAENNLKQVEAKLLDFDWIFTANNSDTLLNILAETENDEIFACNQIRVLIEFMWLDYYDAINQTLFRPFLVMFVSFNLYATQFGAIEGNSLDFAYTMKMLCLIFWGKCFITFFLLELIQFRADPWNYFIGFWNMLDFLSLASTFCYMYFSLVGGLDNTTGFNLQILGSISVVMLWMKLFYWLRLFKPFSAFIRIITEIIKDIRVFTAMLLLCLAAFANVLMVLQDNRNLNGQTAIYDSYVGFGPANALIHAYLTGLGDFNKDYYSEGNSTTVWIFFLLATVIVQLIFMNMIIAIMGESFGRITAITEQSVLKELCVMMNDHIWLLKISDLFAESRYILWLTPGATKVTGTQVERQINQLRTYVEDRSDQSDTTILRQMTALDEKLDAITAHLESQDKPKEESDDDY